MCNAIFQYTADGNDPAGYESNVLGRVLGNFNSLMNLAGPIGLLFAGPLADRLGVEKCSCFPESDFIMRNRFILTSAAKL